MKDRRHGILVSHVGTLPRPHALEALSPRYEFPRDDAAFRATVPPLVGDVARRQTRLGVDIVNDGEFGKRGNFSYYAQTRLAGIERRSGGRAPEPRNIVGRDAIDFPDYYAARAAAASVSDARPLNQPLFCTGPLKYV